MAELPWDEAKRIAAALQTIGHPYADSALKATASDLVKWCKGSFERDPNGHPRIWTPEDQAEWLVAEARVTWEGGWPEKGGTAKLYALFREKFAIEKSLEKAELPHLSYEELIARGLINPPCQVCNERLFIGERPNMTFCLACAEGRSNARFLGEAGLHRLNGESVQKPRATPFLGKSLEKIIDGAAKVLEDEERRKMEQLHRLGETELWEAEKRRKAEQLKKLEESEPGSIQ